MVLNMLYENRGMVQYWHMKIAEWCKLLGFAA